MKSYKDIACHNCGAVLPMEISNTPTEMKKVWYPGKKCPLCGSQEFFPLIKDTTPVKKKAKKEWRYNPWYGISALGILVLIIPLWFFVIKPITIGRATTPSKNMVLICAECKNVFEKKIREKPPYLCPECNEKSAYAALYCRDDFTIYPWKISEETKSAYPPCPECGKVKPAIIFDMKQLEEVRTKHKQYEEWKRYIEEMENAQE